MTILALATAVGTLTSAGNWMCSRTATDDPQPEVVEEMKNIVLLDLNVRLQNISIAGLNHSDDT